MRKRLLLRVSCGAFVALAALLVGMKASGGNSANAAMSIAGPVKIVLVGDSTTAQVTGWGGAFCDRHVTGMVACLPLGRGGRSTKTYMAEGSWQLALNELRVPGYSVRYVLIEMGHNDKNLDPAIGTGLHGDFPRNLKRFVEEAREAGATPMLVTPLARRVFKDGKLSDSLAPWAEEVRRVARDTGTPLLDLNAASADLFNSLGPARSLAFEVWPPTPAEQRAAATGTTLPGRVGATAPVTAALAADDPRRAYTADYIHLNPDGAEAISALVARLLLQAEPMLIGHVRR